MPNFSKDEPTLESPREIASNLAEVYYIEKDAKAEKDELRKDFFLAATLEAESKTLAQKTVAVPDSIDTDEAAFYVKQYNAGWRIKEELDDGRRFVIEEDPSFIGYVVTIPVPEGVVDSKGKTHPGYVVTKTIRSGTNTLDEDRLARDDEELWDEVMTFKDRERMIEIGKGFGLLEEEVVQWLVAIEWPKELKPVKEISEDAFACIQEYFYEGPKTVALNVNYAKEEDL